jgi:uncharacterized NAD(P)/FAD-binding protein YdhS
MKRVRFGMDLPLGAEGSIRGMSDLAVCVVGAGPRGTSVVERLIANAPELAPGHRLRIDVVDPYPPGAGRIWQADQPGHLLMNTLAGRATLFTDETVPCAGPIVPGPSLYEWAKDQGESLDPWSHPSRALQGRYYAWAFARAVAGAPPSIKIRVHHTRAVALTANDRQEITLADGSTLMADAVILTVGHVDLQLDDRQRALREAAQGNKKYYPPAHPLDLDLRPIRPGEDVLVNGFGMNFFDLMSLLTTGRGGTFHDGAYTPSGREPVLHVGSRRGVPYRAKPIYGALPPPARPQHFTKETVARLRGTKCDFRTEVWPLIEADAVEAHRRAGGDGEPDFARLDRPLTGKIFATAGDFQRYMREDLGADLAEARKGAASPAKAAAASIGAARSRVRALAADGGLDPAALARFRGFAAALASGPPASRVEELLALAEAGMVRFVGPGMTITADDSGYTAESPQVKGITTGTTAIEARLPEADVRRTADPLLADLVATGQARPYRETGALEVTHSPFHLVTHDGTPHPARFAVGVPLEGLHFLTALGPEPQAGAAFLAETDAVARAALLAIKPTD